MALIFAYPFQLVRVLDGDTLEGLADLGFYINRRVTVRVEGTNAPEIHGDAEKAVGFQVKACVERWLSKAPATALWLVSKEVDKYGRVLGNIEVRTTAPTNLSAWLLTTKLAQAYDGGTKHAYTPAELVAIAAIAKDYLKG